MFQADGTEIKHIAAYVAKIRNYEGSLYEWEEIKDPQSFALKILGDGEKVKADAGWYGRKDGADSDWNGGKGDSDNGWRKGKGGKGKADNGWYGRKGQADSDWNSGNADSESNVYTEGQKFAMYRADGTPVNDPVAFASKISNYSGGLFNSRGDEIWNPQAFAAGVKRNHETKHPAMYRVDGTPVRNLQAFLQNLRGYSGGLYNSENEEIWDPHAFVAGVERRRGDTEKGGKGWGNGGYSMYQADGTPVKNPTAYVENIENYTGGLYNNRGQEIRDPKAFAAGIEKK